MEVFIAFRSLDDVPLLEKTLERWEEDGCVPVALQCKKERTFELFRRIAADEKAEGGTYILADLGCVLADPLDIGKMVLPMNTGMSGLTGSYKSEIPVGVRLIRRHAVKKWEPRITDDYAVEHVQSVKNAGWRVSVFPDIFYKRLQAHS